MTDLLFLAIVIIIGATILSLLIYAIVLVERESKDKRGGKGGGQNAL